MSLNSVDCITRQIVFHDDDSFHQCQHYREHASVLENQPVGTFVLQVEATDADEGANGRVKYGLMHRDGVLPVFNIHPDTGKKNQSLNGL